MNQKEMKEKFAKLYNYMATSNNTEYMKAFGNTMTEMMDWMIANKPEEAEEWIEKLCSIKWDNYLTQREAEKIVASMVPKAPWSMLVWRQAMNNLGIATEEEPFYNSCALWVTMNMLYSDHAETMANKIWGKPLAEIPTETLVKTIHALALDKLKDKDGVFEIRKYFVV